MTSMDRTAWRVAARSLCACVLSGSVAAAAPTTGDADPLATDRAFSFAVVASTASDPDRAAQSLLRAADGSTARFTVHFDRTPPSAASCADTTVDRRRALLDASVKPAVPVVAGAAWAACGGADSDARDRLDRIGDALFADDESLGRSRLPWLRQSALPRFHRYRENLRWQVGGVLFATINLPDNNNNYRVAAGRNGEFEERQVANRAWLERTFRIATERRLAGVVIFVDAAPRFSAPMRTPDARMRERDGYYEWKLAFREFVPAFKGQVLLVQARLAPGIAWRPVPDRPLQDAAGRTIANFARIAMSDAFATRWLRIDVDPRDPMLYRVTVEQIFDDPSGELYGALRTR